MEGTSQKVRSGKRTIYVAAVVAVVLVIVVAAVLVINYANPTNRLVGDWVCYSGGYPDYELYEDGTCEISNKYGTGTWTVLGGDTLKVTDSYGRTTTAEILDIDKDSMTLNRGGSEVVYIRRERFIEMLEELFTENDEAEPNRIKRGR